MRLEMLAKDGDSGRSGCPSVYIDENGWVVVQGPEIANNSAADGSVLPAGGTRVRIAPRVLVAAAEVLEKRGGREMTADVAARSMVVLDSEGYALVLGPEVEHETRSSLVNLLPGETGVRISTEDLAAAVAALQRH